MFAHRELPSTQLFTACPPPGDEQPQEEKALRDENMHRKAPESKSRLKKPPASIASPSRTHEDSPELKCQFPYGTDFTWHNFHRVNVGPLLVLFKG